MLTEALLHRASLYSLHSIVNTNLNQFAFLCKVWKYCLAWKLMIFGVLNVETMINYHNQKPNSAVLMKIKGKCSSLTELYWWLYKLHSTAALFAVLLLKHTVTLACDRIMKHLWVRRNILYLMQVFIFFFMTLLHILYSIFPLINCSVYCVTFIWSRWICGVMSLLEHHRTVDD